MGDRVSVSFKKGTDESVVLFSHWGGMAFVNEAKRYAKTLSKAREGAETRPLDRLEPETVIVDFIRHITQGMESVESNFYLGQDENCGDNSDNGHHVIDL